jgi:hypothetical protein
MQRHDLAAQVNSHDNASASNLRAAGGITLECV